MVERKAGTSLASFLREDLGTSDVRTSGRDTSTTFQVSGTAPPPGSIVEPLPPSSGGCAGCRGQSRAGLLGMLLLLFATGLLGRAVLRRRRQ